MGELQLYRQVQQRGDLRGASGTDRKGSERELSNGFYVEDSPQQATMFVLLDVFGPSGSYEVSRQNFYKLRGLQLSRRLLLSVCSWMVTTFSNLTFDLNPQIFIVQINLLD